MSGVIANSGPIDDTFSMWTQFLSSAEAYKLAQTQPNPPSETAQADQHAQVTRSLHLR